MDKVFCLFCLEYRDRKLLDTALNLPIRNKAQSRVNNMFSNVDECGMFWNVETGALKGADYFKVDMSPQPTVPPLMSCFW